MLNEHLPEEEKQLFEAIVKNDVVIVKTLLTKHKNVDIFDDNSMTPLQHACYKGNKEIVQMLLDQGADVNLCKHEHGYTALHFAGLSGNVDVCNLLLLAGANTQAINTVGRTAAQMAAFVGHHSCVAIINNFIPKSEIDYYTQTHEPRDKPLLPPIIANSFHAFVMQINIQPIRIAMSIKNLAGLFEHLNDIEKVLESMRLKEMRGGIENNEVMAFKLHYLLFIVKNIKKLKEFHGETKGETQDIEKKFDFVEVLAKKLLKCNKNGDMENLDAFLKDCIREFPHKESTIIRQMVATLADVNAPPAFGIVNAAINGQRGFIDNIPLCSACGEESPSKKCSRCKSVQYCDKICQRLHWSAHKKYCNLENNSQTDKPDVDASELSSQLNNLVCDN